MRWSAVTERPIALLATILATLRVGRMVPFPWSLSGRARPANTSKPRRRPGPVSITFTYKARRGTRSSLIAVAALLFSTNTALADMAVGSSNHALISAATPGLYAAKKSDSRSESSKSSSDKSDVDFYPGVSNSHICDAFLTQNSPNGGLGVATVRVPLLACGTAMLYAHR